MTLPDFRPNTDPVPGWTPPPRPRREPLEGRYVRLEPLSADAHAADLWEAFSAETSGANWTYRLQEPPASHTALRDWLAGLERREDMLYFAYVDRTTGKALGNGALMSIAPAAGSIEVGSIMFAPALQGTRAGTEAIFLTMQYAFDLGYRRFEWTCDSLNAPSVAAAHRFGFTFESVHRAAVVSKDRTRSTALFSITDRDWPAIRAAFVAWLDPVNFDADGTQKTRLSDATAPHLHARYGGDTSPHINPLGQPVGAPIPGWTPPPRPPLTPMEGRTCIVEPLDADRHAADLFAANTSAENWAWLPYGPFDTVEAYHDWITATCTGEDPQFHAIRDRATGRAIGIASYLRINPAQGSIEVGHINYSPLLQRTPMATEAMALMMARAFDLGYRRYEWKCNAANAGSRAAALRLGFTYEGMTRAQLISKGCNRDTAWYGLLAEDWPKVKAGFTAWLDPANFDADGRQRQSLDVLR